MKTTKFYIALLRAVNVSGKNIVKMSELSVLMSKAGFGSVKTYIQSGNLVFSSHLAQPQIIAEIKAILLKNFRVAAAVILRTPDDLLEMMKTAPFLKEGDEFCHFAFLSKKPQSQAEFLREVSVGKSGQEQVALVENEVHLFLPYGSGRTKLTNAMIEKKLLVDATTRNFKTVQKLIEIASE